MEILTSVVTEAAKHLFGPVARQISYLVHLKENIKDYAAQLDSLKARKNDLQRELEESERQLEEPSEEVQNWLQKAKECEDVASSMERQAMDNKWHKWFHPKYWSSRYKKSKKAVKYVLIMKELLEKGKHFSRVSHPQPPPDFIPFSSGDYVTGGSVDVVLDQVMQALVGEDIRTVGVYGMGGVGKTTLLKRLNNEISRNHIFEKIIMVTVSRTLDLRRIQNEIAKRIGLKLDLESSTQERADMLSRRLKTEKRVLLMLDDVWTTLNLTEIGIPDKHDSSECKIVIATRLRRVCHEMMSEKDIEVKVLSDEDSWVLFKEKAGHVVDSCSLQPLPKQVIKECKGLPLAIVAVGSALRMEVNRSVWTDALRALRNSVPIEVEGLDERMIAPLKLSYDFLKPDELKLCFLFCSLFPEDQDICSTDLLYYGSGEGFLKTGGVLEEESNKAEAMLRRLKNSGLLVDGEKKGYVKMHDVFRDVAISIARADEHGFFVRAGVGLKEFPDPEQYLGQCKRISLMKNDIEELPLEVLCPKIRTLLLQGNGGLMSIPDSFFHKMSSLLVLDLSDTGISSLPPSFSCLTNLRTLHLTRCRYLKDVSVLGDLRKLQILFLDHSGITVLQRKLSELTCLRLLNLMSTPISRIPSGVLSKFSHLESMEMDWSFKDWGLNGEGSNWGMACFTEIASLHKLTYLSVSVENANYLFQDLPGGPWENLKRFHISVAYTVMLYERRLHKCSRTMCLDVPRPLFANWVNVLLRKTLILKLQNVRGAKSISEMDSVVGPNCLKFLFIHGSPDMEYFIEFGATELRYAFANLKRLYLSNMPNLVELFRGHLPSAGKSFRNMRILQVSECDRLCSLFSHNILQRLHNLEEVKVVSCKGLKQVFDFGEEAEENDEFEDDGCSLIIPTPPLSPQPPPSRRARRSAMQEEALKKTEDDKFSDDDYKDNEDDFTISQLQELEPEAETNDHGDDSLDRPILPNVRVLEIANCPSVLTLVPWKTPRTFINLQELEIKECNKLKHLFTLSFAQNLGKLYSLKVKNCSALKLLFVKGRGVSEEDQEQALVAFKDLLPELRFLELSSLPKLTCFHARRIYIDFRSLETVKIYECPRMKRLPFGPNTAPRIQVFFCENHWFDKLGWDDESVKLRFKSRQTEHSSLCAIL